MSAAWWAREFYAATHNLPRGAARHGRGQHMMSSALAMADGCWIDDDMTDDERERESLIDRSDSVTRE